MCSLNFFFNSYINSFILTIVFAFRNSIRSLSRRYLLHQLCNCARILRFYSQIITTMPPKTGKITSCPVLGKSCEIPVAQLPTRGDIIRLYKLRREAQPYRNSLTENELVELVTDEIIQHWEIRAYIYAQSRDVVKRKVKQMYERYQKEHFKWFTRNEAKKKDSTEWQLKITNLKELYSQLFDIALCQSQLGTDCQCDVCCTLMDRSDVQFLQDQRNERQMRIDFSTDGHSSQTIEKNYQRYNRNQDRKRKTLERLLRNNTSSTSELIEFESDSENETNQDDEDDFVPPIKKRRLGIPTQFVINCIANRVSQEATKKQTSPKGRNIDSIWYYLQDCDSESLDRGNQS